MKISEKRGRRGACAKGNGVFVEQMTKSELFNQKKNKNETFYDSSSLPPSLFSRSNFFELLHLSYRGQGRPESFWNIWKFGGASNHCKAPPPLKKWGNESIGCQIVRAPNEWHWSHMYWAHPWRRCLSSIEVFWTEIKLYCVCDLNSSFICCHPYPN